MSNISDRLLELLATASSQHTDDRRNRLGTGTKTEVRVQVEDVTAEVSVDRIIERVGHIEKFVLNGKWISVVSKDVFQLDKLVHRTWGDNCEPYGFFTVKVKALDGDIAGMPDVEVGVESAYDERNRFALQFAEGLIKDKIREALGLEIYSATH